MNLYFLDRSWILAVKISSPLYSAYKQVSGNCSLTKGVVSLICNY